MHSHIIQISTSPINEDDYMDGQTLEGYDFYDYYMEISQERRNEFVKDLCELCFPKGMFSYLDGNTLRYNGGMEKWKEDWVRRIKEKAQQVTTENVFEFVGAAYRLKREIENPLDIGTRFCFDQSIVQSAGFMEMVSCLDAGTILYVGNVLDYHY